MSTKIIIILICSIFVFSVNTVYAGLECNTQPYEEQFAKVIVQGEGKIETLADKAYFKIKVRVEEKKLQRAFETSSEKINTISSTLTSAGIKKQDIQNLGYIYHPLYEGKQIFSTLNRPTSYEVIYTIKVTVYDMNNLGQILANLSEITETTVYNLTYTATNIEQLKQEALKKAAIDAKGKATKLAEGAGAVLGKAIKIEATAQEYTLVRELRSDFALKEKSFFMQDEPIAPQIESGSLEIIGRCTVYYALE